MANLPLLADLVSDIISDLQSEYGINISDEQQVALRAFGATESGQQWLQYKVLGFVQKQVWPDTADPESIGGTLERFGRVRLGRNPFPAVATKLVVSVTGTAGAVLPAQTTIYKSDDDSLNPGMLYILDNSYTLPGSTGTITLRALTAGLGAKLEIGNTLSITSPIALVDSKATVTAIAVQPLAGETTEEYRIAILKSFRLDARGGAAGDYRVWAQDAQGVKEVYPYAKTGETNANNIYVESTIADSIDGKGTPDQTMLDAVQAVTEFDPDTTLPVNDRGRRPNTVINYFLPITPLNVDVIITGGSFSTSQKSDILSAMTMAINAVRPFVAAADPVANKNDILDTNKLNGVIYAAVPGAVYTGVTLKVGGVTYLSFTFTLGNIPYFNGITYL